MQSSIDTSLIFFEDQLSLFFSNKRISNQTLLKTAKYSLFAPGKRIRPLFTLAIGGNKAIEAAIAIECIHTFSLIHDDLPSMDDDDIRRGQPSSHIAFGEASAILTGDFLLTYAFEILALAPYPPSIRCRLIELISTSIGASGLIGGQILDIESKEKMILWEAYEDLVLKKTSCLFIATLESGAIIQGWKDHEIAIIREFGHIFGLLFQIKDDLSDKNLPSAKHILGEKETKKLLLDLSKKAYTVLSKLPKAIPFLEEALKSLTH